MNYCIINKVIINHNVKQLLSSQHIKYTMYFTTPAPLQNWLWFVVAGNESGYYVIIAQAIVLCSPSIRYHFKKLVERFIPSLVVLSHNEIASNVNLKSIGIVRLEDAS